MLHTVVTALNGGQEKLGKDGSENRRPRRWVQFHTCTVVLLFFALSLISPINPPSLCLLHRDCLIEILQEDQLGVSTGNKKKTNKKQCGLRVASAKLPIHA